jgi:hypothetical protein
VPVRACLRACDRSMSCAWRRTETSPSFSRCALARARSSVRARVAVARRRWQRCCCVGSSLRQPACAPMRDARDVRRRLGLRRSGVRCEWRARRRRPCTHRPQSHCAARSAQRADAGAFVCCVSAACAQAARLP